MAQSNFIESKMFSQIAKKYIGTELIEKAESICGKEEVQRALEDIESLEQITEIVKKYNLDIDKASRECLKNMYELIPVHYGDTYLFMAMQKLLRDILGDRPEDEKNKIGLEITAKFAEYYIKHQKVADFVINEFTEKLSNIQSKLEDSFLPDDQMTEEDLQQIKKAATPVRIEHFSKDLRLYHGTSLDNYKLIQMDGFIRPSNYKEIDYTKFERYEKNYKAIYEQEDGYLFFSDSIDVPLFFSMGAYRKNVLYWMRNEHEKPEILKELKQSQGENKNSTGVIFIINPQNYDLYYNTEKNEFMIPSQIDLKDTEILYTHFNQMTGEITITNEKGELMNDLLHE